MEVQVEIVAIRSSRMIEVRNTPYGSMFDDWLE